MQKAGNLKDERISFINWDELFVICRDWRGFFFENWKECEFENLNVFEICFISKWFASIIHSFISSFYYNNSFIIKFFPFLNENFVSFTLSKNTCHFFLSFFTCSFNNLFIHQEIFHIYLFSCSYFHTTTHLSFQKFLDFLNYFIEWFIHLPNIFIIFLYSFIRYFPIHSFLHWKISTFLHLCIHSLNDSFKNLFIYLKFSSFSSQ